MTQAESPMALPSDQSGIAADGPAVGQGQPAATPETDQDNLRQWQNDMMLLLQQDPQGLTETLMQETGLGAEAVRTMFINDPQRLKHFLETAPGRAMQANLQQADAHKKEVMHLLDGYRKQYPELVAYEDQISNLVEVVEGMAERAGWELTMAQRLDGAIRLFKMQQAGFKIPPPPRSEPVQAAEIKKADAPVTPEDMWKMSNEDWVRYRDAQVRKAYEP